MNFCIYAVASGTLHAVLDIFTSTFPIFSAVSIAKENAELIGGEISIESEKGKGSTFYLEIPYNDIEVKNELSANVVLQQRCKVLIAEDEEINYLLLQAILEDTLNFNCQILHAKDGLEAVDFCESNPDIALILMDIKMPNMNGYDATIKIKALHPDIPIVAQTAYSTIADKQEALAAGCDYFISKPIDKDVLTKIIDEYKTKYGIIN